MPPPTNPALQQIANLDKSSPNYDSQLDVTLHGQQYEDALPIIEKDDRVWLVDYLDTALTSLDSMSSASRKCLRELRSICGNHGVLPSSYNISSDLAIDPLPSAYGGFGDVYKGTLDGSEVCVKRLRVYTQGTSHHVTKVFFQEAIMWKRLKHPNIVPLLGITISPYQLISNWMAGGDLSAYINAHPDADGRKLLTDAARGLEYLHSCNVVHGDLKGYNILVDVVNDVPCARIADFGVTIVTKNLHSLRPASRQDVLTPRWSAPEVLRGQNPSQETDIYSFAMTMIEVFTGQVPFVDRSEYMVPSAILTGEHPPRPSHRACTDAIWNLMERCWLHDPNSRPKISNVLQILFSKN